MDEPEKHELLTPAVLVGPVDETSGVLAAGIAVPEGQLVNLRTFWDELLAPEDQEA
ncbi:hypothetical protein [Streptomyces misionensis]|uniref:hypothetical protein n=1 Tax=Streptomyces misionensis TaxID=67331 RepID=UPI003BB0DF7D